MSTADVKPGVKSVRVTVCGSYGAGNLGDEASLEAVLGALRGRYPDAEICVITRSPGETERKYGVQAVHSFDAAGILAALGKSGALILGGGSLLQTVTHRRSLYYYLGILRTAKGLGCSVILWGNGIGPLDKRSEKLTARVLNRCADLICLRDRLSLEYLAGLGVTAPESALTADPVFRLFPCGNAEGFLKKHGADPDGSNVCFIVRPWGDSRYCEAVTGAAELLRGKGFTPVFAVLCRGDTELAVRCAGNDVCLPYTDDAALMAAVLGKMRCVVSVRLHGLVLAAVAGVPCVGISYDPKTDGFAELTGISALPVEGLGAESLAESVIGAAAPCDTDKLRAAEENNLLLAAKYMERMRG